MNNSLSRPKSQSFTVNYHRISRVLETEAIIHPAFDPAKIKVLPAGNRYKAIWDTGATGTVVTKKVVQECGLKAIGMTRVHTAGGIIDSPIYLINIMLPSNVGIALIKVSQAESLGGNADILIGMDIIASGDFAVTNINNETIFSFRFPSTTKIDFVAQSNRTIPDYSPSHKIRPNDSCPCGSGKKFKDCCRNKQKK